jgi:hypothetical protein
MMLPPCFDVHDITRSKHSFIIHERKQSEDARLHWTGPDRVAHVPSHQCQGEQINRAVSTKIEQRSCVN